MLAITSKFLFDGEEMLENQAIIFDEKIRAVGPKEKILRKYPEVKVMPFGNACIMPGLVNSHIHFEVRQLYGSYQKNLQMTDSVMSFRAARSALTCLRDGVTAARDMGHKDNVQWDLKKAVEQGIILGPRIRASRGAIVMNYGHGHLSGWNVKNLDEALANIRQQASEGADFIKILASHDDLPHVKDPDLCVPWWSQQELNAMAELAHRCGIKITAHTCGSKAIRMVINAGFDSIEHGECITDDEAIDMQEKGIVLCPTLTAFKQNADFSWNRGQFFHERSNESWKRHQISFPNAVKHHVKMVCGTDNQGNIAEEMELMVSFGMRPVDVLQCATVNGAQLLEYDDIGFIHEGYTADFAIINGNPLEDIKSMRKIPFVIKNGKIYSTKILRELIPKSELFRDDPWINDNQ